LSDAAQISKDSKGNTAAPPILDPNVGGIFSIFFNFNLLHFVLIFFFISSNDFFILFWNSVVKGPSVHCSQQFTRRSGAGFPVPMKCTRIPINETTGDPKNAHTHVAGKDKSFPLTQTGLFSSYVLY